METPAPDSHADGSTVEGSEAYAGPVTHSDGTPAPVNDKSAKASSLTVSILIHAAILVALAFIVTGQMKENPPELTVMASDIVSNDPDVKKEVFEKMKNEKPAAPSKASNLIAASAVTPMAIKTTDVNNFTPTFGIGNDFGTGGLGMGSGGGGGAKFFNQTSTGQRFCFIIDVSASLSEDQFRMIKSELRKSLKRLPSSVQYQVIFFSGPAWFAQDRYQAARSGGNIVSGGKKYPWENNGGGAANFEPSSGKLGPIAKWLPATKTNLSKTNSDIEAVQKSFGTDWAHPLKMALMLKPKPDIIYFLTDGAVGGAEEMIAEVVEMNKKLPGAKAKINTISMMEPRAADNLADLANQTKGKFTIVDKDGTTRTPKT